MKNFIITCLLLLSFSISFAEIKTDFEVVNYVGELSRRADIILLCKQKCVYNLNKTEDKKVNIPYKLKLKEHKDKIDLTLTLKSDKFIIKQPLLDRQTISIVEIETLDNIYQKKFTKNVLKLKFNKEDTLEIRYSIFFNGTNRILLPEVYKNEKIYSDFYLSSKSNKFILSVFFNKGSISLNKKARFILKNIAKSINDKNCDIHIIGYSDNTPLRIDSPFSSNEEIAKKRALEVKKFLEELLKIE